MISNAADGTENDWGQGGGPEPPVSEVMSDVRNDEYMQD